MDVPDLLLDSFFDGVRSNELDRPREPAWPNPLRKGPIDLVSFASLTRTAIPVVLHGLLSSAACATSSAERLGEPRVIPPPPGRTFMLMLINTMRGA